ncbi:hypothetical protein ACNKHX_02500 [Shigella flexneri]
MQAQQALLNAEIDQQRKAWKGTPSCSLPCRKQRDYVTANSTVWSAG